MRRFYQRRAPPAHYFGPHAITNRNLTHVDQGANANKRTHVSVSRCPVAQGNWLSSSAIYHTCDSHNCLKSKLRPMLQKLKSSILWTLDIGWRSQTSFFPPQAECVKCEKVWEAVIRRYKTQRPRILVSNSFQNYCYYPQLLPLLDSPV